MPGSTTTICAKSLARSKAFPSVAKLFAAFCAAPASARLAPAHRQRRLRSAREGALLQLDGSPHDWLAGRGPRLTALGMHDNATGKILSAQFFLSETTEGYFHLLQRLLRRFGIPATFYGYRSGIFVRNNPHWSIEEELTGQRQPTQFGRALSQRGVTFIAAQSPQAKGRVERLWGVLQDRLCSQLRLAQACDLLSANRVLRSLGRTERSGVRPKFDQITNRLS